MHTVPKHSPTARAHLANMQIDTDILTVSKVYGLLRPGKAGDGREGRDKRERDGESERDRGGTEGTLKSEPALNNSTLSLYRGTLGKQIRWEPGLYGELTTRFNQLVSGRLGEWKTSSHNFQQHLDVEKWNQVFTWLLPSFFYLITENSSSFSRSLK